MTTRVKTTTIRATTTTRAETTSRKLSRRPGRLEREAAGAYVGDLFAEHSPMVLGLCRLLLRDPVEAEDAAQQVFLSAHQAILHGSPPRDQAAWMAAIARNECRARIRARMREPLALPDLPSDLPDPLAAAIRAADLRAVWVALGTLPRRQRNALVLRELGGLSYHELGRALGVSHSAIESLLFRARERVRSFLAGVSAAALPMSLRDEAWKLAGAVVGVGAVATGGGTLHSPPAAVVQHASPSRPHPVVHVQHESRVRPRPVVQAVATFSSPPRRAAARREIEVERGELAEPAEPKEGEPVEVQESHEGPGDGGTTEGHSGSENSGSDSSSHSGSDD
jgi:RNA polymerase sigma-70 factor (ECF subfamily)